ncbi:MAG: hypothetical protein M3548_19130 [Actinomycetota bacterium]|nr:hypothetical protein [Actinomycetota bacterium]
MTPTLVTEPLPPSASFRLESQVLPSLSTVVREGLRPRPSGAESHSPTISPVLTSMRTIVPRADAATLT